MHRIISFYKTFSDKRYSTIAGTLVYFLLMSIAPFLLWLTLLFGKVDLQDLTSNQLFSAVEPVLVYLQQSAESAASGAGILLLVTSLYSSTNFFYHLRRSGEIIYDYDRVKGGLRLRLSSLVIVMVTVVSVAFLAALILFGSQILGEFMPQVAVDSVLLSFITMIAVFVAVLLNMFACPYKLSFSQAISGSLLTCALWLIFAVGFTVYLQFANPTRLYGKIAAIIVFLLWCYLMISSLVVGMIFNGSLLSERKVKSLF
ncbi:MAG: YihY/virulence factor BrkB family protein [Candidatus Coproplasma sp.]